ncbi:MAG: hypothetical protein V4858_09890 [Pseudomonadota bacterium]
MNMGIFQKFGDGFVAWTQRIQRLGWPAVLACVLLLAACASLLGAWYAHAQLLHVGKSMAAQQRQQKTAPRSQPVANDALPMAPQDSRFLEDLKAIFVLAKKAGISLGVVEYKTERNEKLPLTMRSIELKVKEDYPKVKGFLSQVLADFPYGSLQEIRVERTDGLAAQGTLLIRLMLVYKSPDKSPDLSAAAPVVK